VSITGLRIQMGGSVLVDSTDIKVSRGDRVAVLGRNGCGKSTLFAWLGTRPASAAWSVYEVLQELPPTDQSVLSVVLSAHLERGRLWARQAELEAAEEMSDAELEEFTAIGEQLEAMRADADPPRVRRILHGLGFTSAQMDGSLSALSGGWRARVALARGLFMEPDLLLLDEPTNHLDLNGVLWLTEFLKEWRKTVVVISHNVGFVRAVANVQWLFRRGRICTYRCRYDRFVAQRVQEETKAAADWEKLDKEVVALKKKGTPAGRKQADSLLTKKAAEGVVRPEKIYRPKFFFVERASALRVGALIACDGADLGYVEGAPVLQGATFALHQGCRVALVGANGSGKSTLLRFLAEEEGLLSGETTVARRPGLRVCKFDQHFYHTLPEDKTPLEYLMSLEPTPAEGEGRMSLGTFRQILGATGLGGETHTRAIGTLSGGQKARVYFGGIAVQAPDVLLMDEPTNHLDMETIAGLTAALQEFPGAAVVVSHDLDFLEEVATETWVVRDGRVVRLGEGVEGLETYVEEVLAAMGE
jgi:ATPase subunit of ABC transporter with duplicated ATPase domains